MPWVHDFFEIDLVKVRCDPLDPSRDYRKGYSQQQMRQWCEDVRELQLRARKGGEGSDDFRQLRGSTDPRERALGETYHKFYDHNAAGSSLNHDFLKVEWMGDHYDVTNGRHRLLEARAAGLTHVPAMVSAPDAATLGRLRAEGERLRTEEPRAKASPVWERAPGPRRERGPGRERS